MNRRQDPLSMRKPDVVVSWPQICGWRLAQQRVTHPASDPLEVAAVLGGVQSQVTSSAEFALGLRTAVAVEEFAAALWEQRTLVKTWAMRGTLHWLPAAEFPLWVAALRTREWRLTSGWEKYHGVTAAQLHAITEAIPTALAQRQLTREELSERLVEVTGSPQVAEQLRSGWGAVLKPAANQGLLCFGPDRGRNVTFVRPQDWLGEVGPEPEPQEGLRVVLHRFLDAYGPATAKDFARWFGVPDKPARDLLLHHADDLVVASADGTAGWVTPQGAESLAAADRAEGVVLLGGFDPYVLAPISHRDILIPEGHLADVSRTAGWISAVVLADGCVVGTWTTDGASVDVAPFASLTGEVRAGLERRVTELAGRLLPQDAQLSAAGS